MPANQNIPPAFSLIENDKSKILGLTVGKHVIETPGQYVPRGDAHDTPVVHFNLPDPTAAYILISLDPDAPFQSWNKLGPALHWFQSGFKAEQGGEAPPKLASSDPCVAIWAAPGPPPFAAPHRYLFFLYEQPKDFDLKKFALPNGADYPISKRMRYSLDKLVEEAKLGPLVGFNYFSSN